MLFFISFLERYGIPFKTKKYLKTEQSALFSFFLFSPGKSSPYCHSSSLSFRWKKWGNLLN